MAYFDDDDYLIGSHNGLWMLNAESYALTKVGKDIINSVAMRNATNSDPNVELSTVF